MNHLESLEPDFKNKVIIVLEKCQQLGIEMVPYFGIRDPFIQAELWRQSRSTSEINAKIKFLEKKGAPFLAHCISSIGPKHGKWVTNAIPGLSWHQWGKAVDCYWRINRRAEWSPEYFNSKGLNGYMVYAACAKKEGLTAGGFWKNFKDWPHVQESSANNPLKTYSYQEIDEIMESKFNPNS
ncbi:hypothetical protein GTQ40_06790 [Flavobacteriaceae bacterium R38]|nr:hypothetical protein [Flavobacteriaceae bacterium R38]